MNFDTTHVVLGHGMMFDEAKPDEAGIAFQVAGFIPVSETQLGAFPAGMIRLKGYDKRALKNLIEELQKVHDEMREPSNIAVANSLQDLDQIADLERKARGGN